MVAWKLAMVRKRRARIDQESLTNFDITCKTDGYNTRIAITQRHGIPKLLPLESSGAFMSRLERLIAMEDEIRRGWYPNVEKFCDMFEVKPRTVYADIRELKERVGLELNLIDLKTAITTRILRNCFRSLNWLMARFSHLRSGRRCWLNILERLSSPFWKARWRKSIRDSRSVWKSTCPMLKEWSSSALDQWFQLARN